MKITATFQILFISTKQLSACDELALTSTAVVTVLKAPDANKLYLNSSRQ